MHITKPVSTVQMNENSPKAQLLFINTASTVTEARLLLR